MGDIAHTLVSSDENSLKKTEEGLGGLLIVFLSFEDAMMECKLKRGGP